MNLLDKFIAYFAPETAVKREAWRQALEEYRSYDAGNYARLNSGWRVTNQPAELEDRASRDVVRARARDLERNSDIANAVTRAYRRNVIGSGWALQANTGKASLNDDIEKLWRLWCKARNCDVTGQQSLNQILRMASDRKRIDGGILQPHAPHGIGPVAEHFFHNIQGIPPEELFPFETRCVSNHTACRFAEKTRFFPLTSGRAALCRRLAFRL